MTYLAALFSYLISITIGFLVIDSIFTKDDKGSNAISPVIHLFLAAGLGLGISSQIAFYGLLFFDQYSKAWCISINFIFLLGFLYKVLASEKHRFGYKIKEFDTKILWSLGILIAVFVPVWIFGKSYPHGGWDAWQVWNYKAKFIYLGGESWRNILDPENWRSSPHYPLLLPLINVWAWTFLKQPHIDVSFLTAAAFTFLTAGLLFITLYIRTKNTASVLAPVLIVTLPYTILLTTNQYADIVLSFYLLASLYCLMSAQIDKHKSYAYLAGLFLGLLTFTKTEGLVAASLMIMISVPYFFWSAKSEKALNRKLIKNLIYGFILTSIPAVIFKLYFSPGNQTFINGLISSEKPSDLTRFSASAAFLFVALKSGKWNGIWILLGIGLLLSKGRCFKRSIRIIPLFLIVYLLIVVFYYYVNTHFEIMWWINVTHGRILGALLPIAAFWVFYSLWRDEKGGR